MAGKRSAATGEANGGQRSLKQTKLNFFPSNSGPKVQSKSQRVVSEGHQEYKVGEEDIGIKAIQEEQEQQQQQRQEPGQTEQANTTTPPTTITITPGSPQNLTVAAAGPAGHVRIRITDRFGDLFAAPPGALLIHACNAVGSWGGGIALAFRSRYPDAFRVYRAHCARWAAAPDRLTGTALLIPPTPAGADGGGGGSRRRERGGGGAGTRHYIGCVFTSRGYGKSRDSPEKILEATGPAMQHLMRLVAEEERRTGVAIAEVRMCRINAGLFAVPWERSKRTVEGLELTEEEAPGCAREGVVEVVAWERE